MSVKQTASTKNCKIIQFTKQHSPRLHKSAFVFLVQSHSQTLIQRSTGKREHVEQIQQKTHVCNHDEAGSAEHIFSIGTGSQYQTQNGRIPLVGWGNVSGTNQSNPSICFLLQISTQFLDSVGPSLSLPCLPAPLLLSPSCIKGHHSLLTLSHTPSHFPTQLHHAFPHFLHHLFLPHTSHTCR